MVSASSIVFLALLFGIASWMGVALLWRGDRHIRDKGNQAAAVVSEAREPSSMDHSALHAALTDRSLAQGAVADAWTSTALHRVDGSHSTNGANPTLRAGKRRRVVVSPRRTARVAGPNGSWIPTNGGATIAPIHAPGERLHRGIPHTALPHPDGPIGPLLDRVLSVPTPFTPHSETT